MDKRDFTDVLRQSLNGEVSADVIEQNVRYYDQYISSQSVEEEAKVIEMLGDPRLIAKTIIETEKAKHKGKNYNEDRNSYTGNYANEEEEKFDRDDKNYGRNIFNINLNWKQKATLILILIAVIVLIVILGRIILGFLFTFGVPILLVLLLYSLFRRRR